MNEKEQMYVDLFKSAIQNKSTNVHVEPEDYNKVVDLFGGLMPGERYTKEKLSELQEILNDYALFHDNANHTKILKFLRALYLYLGYYNLEEKKIINDCIQFIFECFKDDNSIKEKLKAALNKATFDTRDWGYFQHKNKFCN